MPKKINSLLIKLFLLLGFLFFQPQPALAVWLVDLTPPTCSITFSKTSPQAPGTSINVTITASDNNPGPVPKTLTVSNGSLSLTNQSGNERIYAWNTNGLTTSTYTFNGTAGDAAGNGGSCQNSFNIAAGSVTTTPSPVTTTPTAWASAPVCLKNSITDPDQSVAIRWNSSVSPITRLDISANSNFSSNYYTKSITPGTTSTFAPQGFTTRYDKFWWWWTQKSSPLTLIPGTSYGLRTYNGGTSTSSFSVPACTLALDPPDLNDCTSTGDLYSYGGSLRWRGYPTTYTYNGIISYGFWVDLTDQGYFGSTYYHKWVPCADQNPLNCYNTWTSTDMPGGFMDASGWGVMSAFTPAPTTYLVRVFDGSNYATRSFSQSCASYNLPATPYVTTPPCILPNYSGSGIIISWINTNYPATYVYITDNNNFDSYFYSKVTIGFLAKPNMPSQTWGTQFTGRNGRSGPLIYNPNTNYLVRLYNSMYNLAGAYTWFNIPACITPTPTPSCIPASSHWSAWGECTTTCGGGAQQRICIPDPSCPGVPCVGPEIQVCNTTPCANWLETQGGDVHSNQP